ncbi:MAG: tRNA (adenosine(37)-N6)-threonylcarbamoyltransferase complex ATPase subunit type 1 TsaE [Treponema sp.]|jgi:tRNA threonylcarbamoyladenosine biosynthesis protein TsaE|nr:tRNA (adenosine(37)-N6)-threonylcarbamoyltransferase complex ATPase subunit type 1 TsaE [Treponema sp.]
MENFPSSVITSSPEETISVGKRLGALLHRGSVVALRGGLGAGKTWLTKGIALSLGVTEEVTSPTYTIISQYEGRLPLNHIDAYRLQGDDDFAALGAEDLLYGDGVTVIEWSERIPHSIPRNALVIDIAILDDGGRRIDMSAP